LDIRKAGRNNAPESFVGRTDVRRVAKIATSAEALTSSGDHQNAHVVIYIDVEG
jgi:hypothetical protein